MTKGKQRINCYISDELYTRLVQSECNITEAVIKGLEYVLKPAEEENSSTQRNINPVDPSVNDNLIKSLKEEIEKIQERHNQDITGYEENIKALNVEIARLKEVLSNAPDPAELADIKARFEERQRLTEEKDKRIEALEREVSRLDMFAHYFKNVDVKQIEAPAASKVKPRWKFW
jgi:chromosome segregation ATPase